ncbi:1-deoxy-D-xylulose-5-phosphate synthase [Yoonia sp. BS5-3]|uniref:1-deoxy-D-xylulose-5-phosphate synthase n=1 Tax=Yoonia phaeophyticola TaxID=3137369 RepID=A0ABZ2V836_9RHOB
MEQDDLPRHQLPADDRQPAEFRKPRSRIMYIENKSQGLSGPAVIGRVHFSKSGKTLHYKGLKFQSLKGRGFKANYFEIASGDHYWISGPRKDQNDRLYGGQRGVEIDEDIRDEYVKIISRSNPSKTSGQSKFEIFG